MTTSTYTITINGDTYTITVKSPVNPIKNYAHWKYGLEKLESEPIILKELKK